MLNTCRCDSCVIVFVYDQWAIINADAEVREKYAQAANVLVIIHETIHGQLLCDPPWRL